MNHHKSTDRASTFEGRLSIIGETVMKQLSVMFIAHTHLRTPEASGFFLKQAAETINQKMPSELNEDEFIQAMRDVWSELLAIHTSKYWPSIAEITKASNKVAGKIYRAKGKQAAAFKGTIEAEEQDKQDRPPETVEGWLAKLKETDAMIASGELGGGIGQILRKIPCSALARLGYEGDTSMKGIGETPKEHLPDDSGKINMDLIKAGHTAPTFDPFDLAHDDPLPENMQPKVPSLDSL
jgi:hypothetical protein